MDCKLVVQANQPVVNANNEALYRGKVDNITFTFTEELKAFSVA